MKKQILKSLTLRFAMGASLAACISLSAFAAKKADTAPKKTAAPATVNILSKGKAGRAFEYSKSCSAMQDMFFAKQGVHVVSGQKLVVREPFMCKDEGKKGKAKNCVCSCAPNEDPILLSDANREPMAVCLSLVGGSRGESTASNGPKIPPSRFNQ